jgi:hypothetical protein
MAATSAPWIDGTEVHVAQRTRATDDASIRAPIEGHTTLGFEGRMIGTMRGARPASWLDADVQRASTYGHGSRAADASVGFAAGPPPASKSHVAAGNVGQATVRGLWEYQGSRPAVSNGACYATHGTSVRATHAGTGAGLWERRLPGDVVRTGGHLGCPPALAGPHIVVADVSGRVVAWEASSGLETHRAEVGEEIRSQPAIDAGRIYVATAGGTLVCLDCGDRSMDGWPMWGGSPGHNGGGARAG